MKKILVSTILILSLYLSAGAQNLSEKLQNLSVTVHSSGGQGSGVIITRGETNYILTASHVIDNARTVTSFHDNSTGGTKKFSKFKVVTVVKELTRDGRKIGFTEIEAEVIAYSSPEYGDDLALLKLRENITKDSVEFWKSEQATLPTGTKISHVGSFLGQSGSNSYSEGRISQVGRVLFDHVFDQADITGFPGSSGGGIFIAETGEYIGTLVRGAGQGYLLFVPSRRIKVWAKNHNVEFIFDKNAKVDEKAIKLETLEPIEGGGSSHADESSINRETKFNKTFPYLLFKDK